MQGVLEQGTKLTKMGADMGLMTKAMGMANAGNDKARQADTANALVPAKKKARAKLGKLYSWGSGDYGRLSASSVEGVSFHALVRVARTAH